MKVKFPFEPFNTLVKNGKIDGVMKEIIESIKPEMIYFTDFDGCRGCICVLDIQNQSQIPSVAEPFFLNLNAECRFSVAMTPQDLAAADLISLGKKWNKV